MEAKEYLKEQESRLAIADVDQTSPLPPVTGSGTIICSDSRLVFDTAQSITDIRLDRISEIDYSPPSYLNRATIFGILGIVVGVLLWFVIPVIPSLPNDIQTFAGLPVVLGSISVLVGLLMAKATLVIKTGQSTYRFRGDDAEISKLPHAIRGASSS